MDAIRKKMQSLKGETDGLYATIQKFEDSTKEYNLQSDQADCDIRDFGKKVQNLEIGFDETNDKLTKVRKCRTAPLGVPEYVAPRFDTSSLMTQRHSSTSTPKAPYFFCVFIYCINVSCVGGNFPLSLGLYGIVDYSRVLEL